MEEQSIEDKEHDKRIVEAISNALRDVFGEKETSKQFINLERVPLICNSIVDMRGDITEIKNAIKDGFEKFEQRYVSKEEWKPFRSVIYGAVAGILFWILNKWLGLI